MSEFFDVYDEALQHVGVKRRDEVHRDGDWHQVFQCWVIGHEENGETFVILQKRAANKEMFPNKMDISAAGHLDAGETVRDGIRELEEELRLTVSFDDLIPLGRRLSMTKHRGMVDRQICHVFFCVCHQPLAAYEYQEEEISGLLKLPIEAGLRLFSGELDQVAVAAVGLDSDKVCIGTEDFISNIDQYVFKILILARRYFAGETDLLI